MYFNIAVIRQYIRNIFNLRKYKVITFRNVRLTTFFLFFRITKSFSFFSSSFYTVTVTCVSSCAYPIFVYFLQAAAINVPKCKPASSFSNTAEANFNNIFTDI